jgi:hypothetical protein
LIRFSGIAKDEIGKLQTGVIGITFSLYRDAQGGAPLWIETQNVQADATGHYTALLGVNTREGLPLDAFSSGEAHYIGVQILGQPQSARVLLVSVPYAVKAEDAATIGGFPPSAFVLANAAEAGTGQSIAPPNPAVTGKGTLGYIPMWDTTSDLVNSVVFQKSSAVGIATITPAATLDVNGKADIRDTLTLFPKSTDNTLAVNGTNFKLSSTGLVTFVSGQTFPGAGTVTGVVAGTGLSGGGKSGSVSLSIGTASCASGQALTGLPLTCHSFATTGANTFTGAQTISGDLGVKGMLGGTDGFFSGDVVSGTLTATSGFAATSGTFTGALTTGAQTVTGNVSITGNIMDTGNITASGTSSTITGVMGSFRDSNALQVFKVAQSSSGNGILSTSTSGIGIVGTSSSGGTGVQGNSTGYRGVVGNSDVKGGVVGISTSGDGIGGVACGSCSGAAAIFGIGKLAGAFSGTVAISGNLAVTGVKAFHIDHPLDPANKYLNHFSVESNEVLNSYSGNVITDSSGSATVRLPDYFSALNKDYRYQLTVIGEFAQAIIFKEIENNIFVIKTDKPSVKVSWQVTGVRSDAYASTYPVPVEENKPEQERGYYLAPEVFGQGEERSITWLHHSDFMRDAKAVEEKAKQGAADNPH